LSSQPLLKTRGRIPRSPALAIIESPRFSMIVSIYNCTRAFLPLVVASPDGYIVNTSSVNGFWASIGPGWPHTAYCSAKFAVKGFSEALIEDLRVHAPHVKVAVVMPGHIGTSIVANTRNVLGKPPYLKATAEEVAEGRGLLKARGLSVD